MRIALISHGDLVHVLPYMEYMLAEGMEVHWLQIAPGRYELPGVQVHKCYAGKGPAGFLGKLGYFASGARARRILEHIKPDVVNAHYASSAGLAAWRSGFRPYAVTIHGSDLISRSRSWLGRAILRRVLRQAALVNPVCGHMLGLLSDLGISDDSIMVMPFGIELRNLPFRDRSDLCEGGIRIVCTRSLGNAVYDIPTVIRAVAEARNRQPGITLSLPAGGELQGEFESLSRELGVDDVVDFGGGYEPQELPRILAEHDVYVSASLWDGASLSLMEAMASGLFPVVSDVPANSEWLEDGENARLFPPGDWRGLARILIELPQRKEMMRRAVVRNREAVEHRGDRRKNIPAFLDRLTSLNRRP